MFGAIRVFRYQFQPVSGKAYGRYQVGSNRIREGNISKLWAQFTAPVLSSTIQRCLSINHHPLNLVSESEDKGRIGNLECLRDISTRQIPEFLDLLPLYIFFQPYKISRTMFCTHYLSPSTRRKKLAWESSWLRGPYNFGSQFANSYGRKHLDARPHCHSTFDGR